MIDFSTNKYIYIYNIQIKHLHDTYYSKVANETTVFIKNFIDRQIELKNCWAILFSFLSFVLAITTRQLQDFYFCLPLLIPGTYKRAISFSSWKLYKPLVWVLLQNPTNFVLWTSPKLLGNKFLLRVPYQSLDP